MAIYIFRYGSLYRSWQLNGYVIFYSSLLLFADTSGHLAAFAPQNIRKVLGASMVFTIALYTTLGAVTKQPRPPW
jgi:hypothetical protein